MKRLLLAALIAFAPLVAKAQTTGSPGFVPGAPINCTSVASLCLNLQNPVGTTVFSVDKTGIITIPSSVYLLASGGNGKFAFINNNIPALEGPVGDIRLNTDGSLGLGANARLYGEAANTVAQRNGVNAQTFNIYNTFTDASNYELGTIGFGSNLFKITTTSAGTGTARGMQIGTVGSTTINFITNNTNRWQIDASGNFIALTDNSFDIGASGANRPKNLFLAGNISMASGTITGAGGITGTILTGSTWIAATPKTVSTLATCNSAADGARSFVTDATSTTFASTVAGSGSNHVPVYCDGSGTPAWKIG